VCRALSAGPSSMSASLSKVSQSSRTTFHHRIAPFQTADVAGVGAHVRPRPPMGEHREEKGVHERPRELQATKGMCVRAYGLFWRFTDTFRNCIVIGVGMGCTYRLEVHRGIHRAIMCAK
jgi:hypothetical protein